jgi:hypothetical protein
LSRITINICPTGTRGLGIALTGRFAVTLRFGTAAFRRVFTVRQATKQIVNF